MGWIITFRPRALFLNWEASSLSVISVKLVDPDVISSSLPSAYWLLVVVDCSPSLRAWEAVPTIDRLTWLELRRIQR